jgi:hypothetical protein
MNVGETRHARSYLASIIKEHLDRAYEFGAAARPAREHIAYVRGALDFGLKIGAISLPEKEASLAGLSGYPHPPYLDEWWKETAVFLCRTGD